MFFKASPKRPPSSSSMIAHGAPQNAIRDVWMADVGPDVPDQLVIGFVEAVDAAFGAAS
jgi:hypothetical protein